MLCQRNTFCESLRETDAISPDDLEKRQKKDCTINTNQKLMPIVCRYLRRHWRKYPPSSTRTPDSSSNYSATPCRTASQCGNVALTDPDGQKAGLGCLTEIYGGGIVPPQLHLSRHCPQDYDGEKAYIRIEARRRQRSIWSWLQAATSKSSITCALTWDENLPRGNSRV